MPAISRELSVMFKQYENVLKASGQYAYEKTDFCIDYCSKKSDVEFFKYIIHSNVQGGGSELETIASITNLVHNMLSGGTRKDNFDGMSAEKIYEIVVHQNAAANCKAYAKVLHAVFSAMGYISKYIFCKPVDLVLNDCHVVVQVYSNELNKWVLCDPALNIMFVNHHKEPMNLEELRRFLIKGVWPIVVHLNQDEQAARINQIVRMVSDENIIRYYIKNLFRFSMLTEEDYTNIETEINLVPKGYMSVPFKDIIYYKESRLTHIDVFTSNPTDFWMKP